MNEDQFKKKEETNIKIKTPDGKVITIVSKPGEDGYTPIKGKDYFDGEKGEDYTLTDKDKKEIASSIKVPVIEKVVEKVEVIRETPIITNEIKEVAKYEEVEAIVKKLVNYKKKWLPIDAIDGDFNTKVTRISSNNKVVGISSLSKLTDVDLSGLSQDSQGNFILRDGITSIDWGGITGTLSDQTDLQTVLDTKTTKNFAIAMALALG